MIIHKKVLFERVRLNIALSLIFTMQLRTTLLYILLAEETHWSKISDHPSCQAGRVLFRELLPLSTEVLPSLVLKSRTFRRFVCVTTTWRNVYNNFAWFLYWHRSSLWHS